MSDKYDKAIKPGNLAAVPMDNGAIRPDGPVRDNAAWRRYFEHEERMARMLAPREPSYEITQKSPAGKTTGFEWSIQHPDPEECARQAMEWAKQFPGPQPVVKS